MSAGPRRYTRDRWLSQHDLFNAVTLAASRTSSTFSCEGFTTLVLWVNFTFSSESSFSIAIDTQPEGDTTNWYESQTATFTAASGDLANTRYVEDGGATKLLRMNADIYGKLARVRLIRTAGDASDLVTMRGLLQAR